MDMIVGRTAKYAGFILRNTSFHVPKASLAPARCLCQCDNRRQNVPTQDTYLRWRIAAGSNYIQSNYALTRIALPDRLRGNWSYNYSSDGSKQPQKENCEPQAAGKPTVFQRMKQMTKDYWHILIPVHVVTSIGWITLFYTAAKNGVNIVSILESMNLSERYLDIMRGSNAGHWAVAYALYKIFTPIRYTVTIGGTTMSIRWLNKWGYLKFKPRSTITEKQSRESAAENGQKFAKTGFKSHQQTEPPKT